jgi:hypothetical protein
MPDESGVNSFIFPLEGGLVLNRSTFSMHPGMALELENFEPDPTGGYRRINGYNKWNSSVVPYTTEDTETVLMSAMYGKEVIAARGEAVYRSTNAIDKLSASISAVATTIAVSSTSNFSSTGTALIGSEQITYTGKTPGSLTGCTRGANSTTAATHASLDVVSQYWHVLDTGRTGAGKYNTRTYNLGGTEYILWADGVNAASYFDGTTVTDVTGASSPSDPKYVVGFKNTTFYAGMSATQQELVFTAPYTVDDFSVANGAGSIAIDSPITALKVFREQLYIIAEERIYRLSGSSVVDFTIEPVTRNIGCKNGATVQEFGGDIVFLGPDGLRSIAATSRIGDVELGTISSAVQTRFDSLTDVSAYESVVIADKTQYRIFFTTDGAAESATKGIICSRKADGYVFSEIRGIKPSCSDVSSYQGESYIIHGGYDGYVYRQEQGNTFDGTTIIGRYRSPDIVSEDAGVRKNYHRVITNYAPTGIVNADLLVRYDYESPDTARPLPYRFDVTNVVALYGTGIYGGSTYGGQTNPLVRQSIEGSGFAIALRVIDTAVSAPYTLKGFQLEFTIGARR